MKALYDVDGVSSPVPVEILAWDGDKYVKYQDSDVSVGEDKMWKFGIKVSNRWYKTPEYSWDGSVVTFTNKQISKMLKEKRKRKITYHVSSSEGYKKFKSLKKALNFCKGNENCNFMSYSADYKRGFSSGPVLEKEDGLWYYFVHQTFVSETTLNRWIDSQ